MSYSAWNRRVGLAFAARYRARCSSRVVSRVVLAASALTNAYLPHTHRPSAAPSHPRALPRFLGTLWAAPTAAPLSPTSPSRGPLIGLVAPRPPTSWHPRGSLCWGGVGSLLFPRWLCQRSTPSTPLGSSGLLLQALHPFHGLRPAPRGSAPSWSPFGGEISTRQASLHAADRWLAPSLTEGSSPRFDAQVSLHAGGLLRRCLGTSFGRTSTG